MKKPFVALVSRSLFVLLLTCTLADAENTPVAPQLQKLKHTTLAPNREQVVLQLNGSYSPKISTLKDENPRIIFDFDGMTCGKDIKAAIATNGSVVKQVRVGRHDGESPKTRVVFDVATFKGLSYTQEFDESNSSLVIQFTGTGTAAAPPRQKDNAPAKTPAEKTAATPGPPPAKPPEAAKQPAQPEPSSPAAQPAVAPAPEAAAETPKQQEPATVKPPSSSVPDKLMAENAAKPDAKEAAPPDVTASIPDKPAEKTATPPASDNKNGQAAKTAVQEAAPPPETAAKKTEAVAPKTDKPAETGKPAILSKTTDSPQLEYVKFDGSSPKGEMVMFKLNGFHPPAVHGVEEGIPRVICDFSNTKLLQAAKNPIKTNGKFVKMIRTLSFKKPEKVRVMIDLEPNRSYDLQQVFFKEDNLFVLFVNTVKK